MVVDILIVVALIASAILGYRNGLMSTLFKSIGYLAGGLLGFYLSLNQTHGWNLDIKKVGIIIAAIALGGWVGSFAGAAVAKGFRATLFRGPLAFLDSILGASVEIARTVIVIYLIASILLWSPINFGKEAVRQSALYPKIESKLPKLITHVKDQIKNEFSNLRL